MNKIVTIRQIRSEPSECLSRNAALRSSKSFVNLASAVSVLWLGLKPDWNFIFIFFIFYFIICILFTTQYNQNIHNEGQIHIIEHTDLTTEMWTDFESFLQQILFNKWNN